MPLMISRSVAARLLTYEDVLAAVEQAHAALATGSATQAGRQNLAVGGSTMLMVPMLAASPAQAALGLKLLVDAPDNPDRGLPRQQSTVLLVDPATGACEAVLDGAGITLFRTAAASAVATRHLAPAGPATLGLIGAGAQAWAHVQALGLVRPIEQVVVWSRRAATAERLADRCRSAGLHVECSADPYGVVEKADILCTLTPSVDPLVRGAWLREGTHLNLVGAPPRPTHREVDDEVIARSRVFVDDRHAAAAESGAVLSALRNHVVTAAHVATELGEVIAGLKAGRTTPDDITLYNSVGIGIQDVVTARLVADAARRHGLGEQVALDE